MFDAGDRNTGAVVEIPFNTNAVAGESITIGTNGTIAIYKDGSTTERSSASGVTFSEDHDGHVGSHLIRIDLADNADAGFFAAGSSYKVKYHTATIDGKAISAWVGMWSIERLPKVNATQVAGTPQTPGDIFSGTTGLGVIHADTGVGGVLDGRLEDIIGGVNAETALVTDIKAKSDQLTFTVANVLDTNLLRWLGTAPLTPRFPGIPMIDNALGGRIWYIDANVDGTGDLGSREAPFDSFSQAEASGLIKDGDTLHLMSGAQAVVVVLHNNMTIEAEGKATVVAGIVVGDFDGTYIRNLKVDLSGTANSHGITATSFTSTKRLTIENVDSSGDDDGLTVSDCRLELRGVNRFFGHQSGASFNNIIGYAGYSRFEADCTFASGVNAGAGVVCQASTLSSMRWIGCVFSPTRAAAHANPTNGLVADGTHEVVGCTLYPRATHASNTGEVNGIKGYSSNGGRFEIDGSAFIPSNAGSGAMLHINGSVANSAGNVANSYIDATKVTGSFTSDFRPTVFGRTGDFDSVGAVLDRNSAATAAGVAALPSAAAILTAIKAGTLSNTPTLGTIEEALVAARAQGFGKWSLDAGTRILTLYGSDGTTAVKTILIGPDLLTPLTRTPQ